MKFYKSIALALLAISLPVLAGNPTKSRYPPLVATEANFGPGCHIKLNIPKGAEFPITYGTVSGKGGGSVILVNPPYLNGDWFLGFICYSKQAKEIQLDPNGPIIFDNDAQIWRQNSESPDVVPEAHFSVHQIISPNGRGWATTANDTAVDLPEKRLGYCIYHGDRAICGRSDVGQVKSIQRHPLADRTQYVLKILNSIEFLEDASPIDDASHLK